MPPDRKKIKKQKSWPLRITLVLAGGFWGFQSFFQLLFREGRELGALENLMALPGLLMGLVLKLTLPLLERVADRGPTSPAVGMFLFALALTLTIVSGGLLGLTSSLIIEKMALLSHRIFAARATRRHPLAVPALAGIIIAAALASLSWAYLSYNRWFQELAAQRRNQIIPASDIIELNPQDMNGAVRSVPEPPPMPNN